MQLQAEDIEALAEVAGGNADFSGIPYAAIDVFREIPALPFARGRDGIVVVTIDVLGVVLRQSLPVPFPVLQMPPGHFPPVEVHGDAPPVAQAQCQVPDGIGIVDTKFPPESKQMELCGRVESPTFIVTANKPRAAAPDPFGIIEIRFRPIGSRRRGFGSRTGIGGFPCAQNGATSSVMRAPWALCI